MNSSIEKKGVETDQEALPRERIAVEIFDPKVVPPFLKSIEKITSHMSDLQATVRFIDR